MPFGTKPGAIYSAEGNIAIAGTTFTSNTATGDGGESIARASCLSTVETEIYTLLKYSLKPLR